MKIIVRNFAVNYDDQGVKDLPVILLLHGWGSDLHTFDALVLYFIKEYRVIRLDLPGFGETEFIGTAWHLDTYVDFVDEFIKKLGVEVSILVGHSFGGRISMKGLALDTFHPKRVVLIASAGIAHRKSMQNGVIMAVTKTGKAITSIPPFSFMREGLRKKLYKTIGSDYGNAGVLRQTFLNIIREDLSESARAIAIPTLLIWGSRDTETPLVDGERLSHLIPGAKLVIFAGAGHFVHCENPKEVADSIKLFLS